ncbi:hypothetical protein F2Q69_00024416 [Brassica cretica]|uniref:Uncharacterized protein n=1 Tax=Brassica cretica TaxID=69181 RepID=A0A8S9QDC2_BRACR|nr:hypothetical protein F2Q69_00024416 [Brassica cretica]
MGRFRSFCWVVNASACCFEGMICIPPTRWYTIVSDPEIISSDTTETGNMDR